MKKEKISFRIIGETGPLMISWYDGPKGDAVEANNEIGVGFFSTTGELLAVEFDDVNKNADSQFLEFDQLRIDLKVKKGEISYSITKLDLKKTEKKKRKKAA
ncbi:MAG: hypothetical protein A2504_01950 [Bdellovibrionales bacterium RIFOXYD12_FULL_39_22]|nr:MAG: hypothetical protein A2385_04475 [Bdellovibrionales bacterium RIFOXYB1_FULL_39_21]OFZ42330.1 MAG: hypothetical protein A2485_15020 [Bdellovibrionales bacterium RIFOXYC12_FULL_39_17]OFZ46369.1 MAG: hypothetical protein A2404_13995 [Bdellovibrionales bacterium RIFOXYC1_FULL_39_130]OFZ72844.1 MAG: hypothetical protein A2451_10225 [Bdellovibrionales bacterium RIFOXYC2_FULL_39_8]OFZ75262.1 MAG: hypothetical protein A2560_16050 [Bdellovibrionales bacterium RIFOXYD1_FULL_39_84]OFZ93256.1 MAG: